MENRKEKIVNTYDHGYCIRFYLPKEFVETLNNNSVVIEDHSNCLFIREAMIDDYKSYKIGKKRIVTYAPFNGIHDFIGEFLYEIKGETLVLTKK